MFGRQKALAIDPNTKTLVIPASITKLEKDLFRKAKEAEVITFEPGSQLVRIKAGSFSHCHSLRSICIAASVESLSHHCFVNWEDCLASFSDTQSEVEVVRFEPGSRLREIEPDAFDGCFSLRELWIPASVETMTGASLPVTAFDERCQIQVEPENRFFRREGGFLIDLKHHSILRYLDRERNVEIPDEIEKIDEHCFRACTSIRSLTFGSASKLTSIEKAGFCACRNLKTIAIPSSVTRLGDYCFRACQSLQGVSFSGSTLKYLPDCAFGGCLELKSIILPSTVNSIGSECFAKCLALANSPFSVDSEIAHIRYKAFESCSSLKSLFLPASVEVVDENCFEGCDSLSTLTFGSPSHLRNLLDVPRHLSGVVPIPDSVEIMWSFGGLTDHALEFGPESRLIEIKVKPIKSDRRRRRQLPSRSFERVSSRTLKMFRKNLEFETET
jgi:hypothetical protein